MFNSEVLVDLEKNLRIREKVNYKFFESCPKSLDILFLHDSAGV